MFKDTILCPWNYLHWVVGRAELLVAVDSGVSSLKIENRLTGAPKMLEEISGRSSITPFVFVCARVC